MIATRFRQVGLGLTLVGCGAIAVACGSDATTAPGTGGGTGGGFFGTGGGGGFPPGTGGALPGTGGALPGTGGAAPGTGGAAPGTGGSTSNTFVPIGTVTACPGASYIPASSFPACTIDGCQAAHCVPASAVPAGTDATLLADCPEAGNKCVPDDFIGTLGKFLAKTCTSLLGAEGRCLSTCVPQIHQQANQLPKDVCADTELCAPCFNPIDGSDTHACNRGCDTGPKDPTVKKFAPCGLGGGTDPLGICVPSNLVPEDLKSAVPKDTCTGADELCAPIEKAKDLNYKFPSCAPSAAGLPPDPSQKGGCVPKYIALNNPSGALLTDSGQCAAGFICAPCVNPLDQTETGACK